MTHEAYGFPSFALPAGEDFLERVALVFLDAHREAAASGDLSSVRILAPSQPIAAELRSALLRVDSRPMLLPNFGTLAAWVQSAPIDGIPDALPDCQRQVLLHEALRERGWFDEAVLWGIAAEMADLFDELTEASVALPDSAEALAEQLHAAYALRASAPLAFEASVVHELWRALSATGKPDAAAAYRLRLAALVRAAQVSDRPAPLFVLLDAAPEESLTRAECDFLRDYGTAHRLTVCYPAPRRSGRTPLMALLDAAWPENPSLSLFERAQALAAQFPQSPLGGAGRLQLVPASGREPEARAAVALVAGWLAEGRRRIVLITQDRLTARRVRALLEREGVLASDETGWKLSTSRAAATVDALIETVVGNAYYRDVLDLCKSPFVFSDCEEGGRKAAVHALESAVRERSVRSGLTRMRRALREAGREETVESALKVLDRVDAASLALGGRRASLARWIDRLTEALAALGALESLGQDAAGKALLDLLATRRAELADIPASFSLPAWRDWLNREFEAATFRDAGISSPIVLTPLNAVCLRRFEAAVLIGGDARQMAPSSGGRFFNQAVRRELGLRTREDGERELRRDLELLLATVPQVAVTWQSERDGEANLLAPEWLLLSTVHRLAWQDDLKRSAGPARPEATPDAATAPGRTVLAAPRAPSPMIPKRVSVSGYACLVGCPYRFFARHVLRLGEMDEVSEEMEKSDYGALVHRTLEHFHERHPRVSELSDEAALAALRESVSETFASAVEENFLATGWRLRWEKRLAAYLDWQRRREAEGWRWTAAESALRRALPLRAGGEVELYGRIDRIDCARDGAEAMLLDYKTQSLKAIRDRLRDDVQLPAYMLLHGDAEGAAYLALDDDKIDLVQAGDAEDGPAASAIAQGVRLQAAFSAMHEGACLPANGADSVCTWCEMRGLCRRDYV